MSETAKLWHKIDAPEIVRHLLEDEEDDFDVKDVTDPIGEGDSWWEQIEGDYGDPWEYGGTWYNPVTHTMLHFEGLETMEQLEIGEIKSEDVEVPPQVMAKIDQQFPPDYVDPDGDLEWQQRQRNDNERKRDQLIDQYKVARAAFLNERKKFPWYEIGVPESGKLEQWMDAKVPNVAQMHGLSEQEFRALPLANQIIAFVGYLGIDEFGSKFMMSKREAEQKLKMRL